MQLSFRKSMPGRVPATDIAGSNSSATQTAIAPIVITAVGVDERMLFAISLFFRNRLGQRYAFGNPQEADIWLFDLDHGEGRSAWDSHQSKRPGAPAILVSIAEKDVEQAQNTAFALKPLSGELLENALERVKLLPREESPAMPAQKGTKMETSLARSSETKSSIAPAAPVSRAEPDTFMPDSTWYQDPLAILNAPETGAAGRGQALDAQQHQRSAPGCYGAAAKLGEQHARVFIGSTPDIDVADPQQLAKAQFDPDRFLAGAVSRAAAMAVREQQPVMVSGKGWDIVVRPNPDRAFVDIRQLQLRTLATLPLHGDVTMQVLDRSVDGHIFDGDKWRLPAFQWTLTLMAARGRVPIDTDLSAKVKLRQWPNMTRLQTFPNSMRIASLWSREPISLLESATVLGIPQRYVFTFYSAVNALALVETLGSEKTTRDRPNNRPAKRNRGLFRKILAHLRLG